MPISWRQLWQRKMSGGPANGLNLTYHLVLSVLNVMTVFLPPKPACVVSLKVLFLVLYSQYLYFISP